MAHQRRALPIDDDRGTIGETARHTIAVAAGKNGNRCIALGAPRGAITHRLAARDAARGDDRRLESHHGRKAKASRAGAGKGRDAVERNAGADPIAVRAGGAQYRGGVADARCERAAARQRFEACELLEGCRSVALIRARQMREQPHLARPCRQALQARKRRGEFLAAKPQAIHARVDLQPQNEWLRGR